MNTEAQFLRYGHYYDKIDLYIAECNFYKNLVEKAHFTHSPIIKMNNFLPINQEYKAYYEHDNYILYFGRYAREKGVLTILKAYAKMHCDEKLVLVGKGSEEDSVDYIMAVPASENHLLGIISVLIEKTIGKGRIFSGTYYILLGALIARTRIFAKAKIILPVLVGTFLAAAFLNLFLMKIIMSVMFFMLVLMCNCSGDGRKFRRTSTVMYYICKKRVKESSADKTIYKYLVGKWYNAEKTRIHAKRKEERRKSLDLAIKKKGEEGQLVSIPVDRISKVIAVQISMSYNSVESYGMLAKFLDEIAEKDEAFFTALVENKIVVSFEKMRKLAQMDETKLIDIRRKLLREEDVKMRQRKPRQQSTDGLSGKTQQKQTTPLEVGIKEMPMFDPDMEFRGLALTIPTWMNAIARTRAKTDIDLVSEPTKAQLAVILRRLEEQITQTLEVIER